MASKLPKATLSLKQFLVRQEVLKLYRNILRTLRSVPDASTREELKDWARADFKKNKHHTDEVHIKTLLHHGCLKDSAAVILKKAAKSNVVVEAFYTLLVTAFNLKCSYYYYAVSLVGVTAECCCTQETTILFCLLQLLLLIHLSLAT